MLVPATPYSHKFHPLLLLTTQTGGAAAAAAGTAERSEYVHEVTEHLKSNRAPHALDTLKKIREEKEKLFRGVSHSTGSHRLRSSLAKGLNDQEGGDQDFGTPAPPAKKRKSSTTTTTTTKKSTTGSKGGKGKKTTKMSSDKDKSKSSDDPLAKALAELKETKAELKKANDTIKTKEDTIKVQKMVSFRLCLG